jgi:hypothetical protein
MSCQCRASASRAKWPTLLVAMTTFAPGISQNPVSNVRACAAKITSASKAKRSAVGNPA